MHFSPALPERRRCRCRGGCASRLAFVFLFLSAALRAASPDVEMISPPGGQRGSEAELTITGNRLADARGLLFYAPGIDVTSVQPSGDGMLKARVRIAPDCALGRHELRLWTATGLSGVMLFQVGPYPNVAEAKPDNIPARAQRVAMNSTVNGVIHDDEIAYFAVDAKRGQRLTAEVEGMRLGLTMFDPWLAILTEKGRQLAYNDDNSLLLQDPLASIIVPEDGAYLIAVRDSTWGGGGKCLFRLHVGAFPQPLVAYPLGGQAGEEIAFRLIGDPAGVIDKVVRLPAQPSEAFPLFADQYGLTAPAGNVVRVSPFPNVLEVYPNNDIAHATVADKPLPLAFNGVIVDKGASGYFKFNAKKGDLLDVSVYARRLRSALDSVLTIHDEKGKQLASNDDSAGPDSYLRFKVPADGGYYLSVRDQLGRAGPNFPYRVEVTPVHPGIELAIPELVKDTQERQSIVVPRGNRYATVFRVRRGDFDAPFTLDASGLPPGVTFTAGAPEGDVVPVVFEAAPEAADASALCSFGAQGGSVRGRYVQTVDLVRGVPNNSVYLSTSVDKLAVAVADAAPFKLAVSQAKLGIPQNCAMDLKIVAMRDPGFNAPITVSLLNNPPGLGSQATVTIPAGAGEATLPINVNGNAGLHAWKVAVIGSADTGKGAVWVASPFVDVEIEKSPVTASIEKANTEQGRPVTVICDLTQNAPFEGKAKVELFGLPNKAVAPPCEITSADHEVRFNVTTDPTTPAGRHKDLFCRITFERDGAKIVETTAQGGLLRIDKPTEVAAK